ncbi:MAG: metallophosphoesterase family protein [Nitrospirae bacterium]|nr:metallophosphoesterase family protein [Nitrospirota bacterium]
MRIAIISDVHANLEALQSVLEEIKKEMPDEIWFLGDAVGYGPNPNECIDIIKKEAQILIAGNHDWGVAGLANIEHFNPYAREAAEWTIDNLTDENNALLRSLPLFDRPKLNNIFLVHSSPKEPEKWHYIINTWDAYINFQFFAERKCIIGHSHYPFAAELDESGRVNLYKETAEFKTGCRYIINAGSVGQPRDGNPKASYAVLTKNSVEIRRVSYDIVSTQKKMKEAGLSRYLIERLDRGR